MGSKTSIEYVDATWNPWSGCTPVSPGCANCYAKRIATRFGQDFSKVTRAPDKRFREPLRWKTGKRILTCSMSDFFHKDADEWRDEAWDIIRDTSRHTYLILTKHLQRIRRSYPYGWCVEPQFWAHVWLGATVENQKMADKRIPELLNVEAAVRFLSIEPMLGPVDLLDNGFLADHSWRHGVPGGINWVIVGGESGPGARPMEADWARSIRDQCKAAGVPFFMKQMAKREPIPEDLNIKEFPE